MMKTSSIRPGPGTRITTTPLGYTVAASSSKNSFGHPFKPSLGVGEATLVRGLVNGFEPIIQVEGNKIPMSGDDKNPQPALKLDLKVVDAKTNQSWICVEVTPNDDGSLDKESLIEIVHRNAPASTDPKVGRQALALIFWNNKNSGSIYEITFFNLRYVRTTPGPGQGTPRHFFL